MQGPRSQHLGNEKMRETPLVIRPAKSDPSAQSRFARVMAEGEDGAQIKTLAQEIGAVLQKVRWRTVTVECETHRGFRASLGRGQPLHLSKDEEKMRAQPC